MQILDFSVEVGKDGKIALDDLFGKEGAALLRENLEVANLVIGPDERFLLVKANSEVVAEAKEIDGRIFILPLRTPRVTKIDVDKITWAKGDNVPRVRILPEKLGYYPDYKELIEDIEIDAKKQLNKPEMKNVSGDNEKANKLKEAFELLSKLPTREIERLVTTIEKRCEKWGDDIPIEAPELYRNRQASESLPEFLRRVYGVLGHLDGRLTTAHLDILDPALADAVRGWISHHGSLPEDILLPNKFERGRQPPRKKRRQETGPHKSP